MTYPRYLRDKARTLRTERTLSVDEIAVRLGLPKTTIWHWVADLPLGRPRHDNPHAGTRAMQAKYQALREAAYAEAHESFADLSSDRTFRDFICLYIGEGYKRSRNAVALANSDPRVVCLAARWIRQLAQNKVRYAVQYHADQDLGQLRAFWAGELAVSPPDIAAQRKSNSGRLAGRHWRSPYGVLTVSSSDTLLRARLEAWMKCVQAEWLDSPEPGRSSAW